MFLPILALALTACVVAFPTTTQGPFLAVVFPTNTTTGTGFKPPGVFGNQGGFINTFKTNDFNFYHRGEFQFIDFQMNQTTPFSTSLTQPMEIWTNVTYGPHPTGQSSGSLTSPIPPSTEWYSQLFAGNYTSGVDNTINIDRTWSVDMCGLNYTMGYIDVWVRPLTGSNPGAFQEGFYTCFFNFNYPDTMLNKPDAKWSPIMQCNSGPINNYSFRLWYQFRFYNVHPNTCMSGKFVTL
jgi:hypothetical protein